MSQAADEEHDGSEVSNGASAGEQGFDDRELGPLEVENQGAPVRDLTVSRLGLKGQTASLGINPDLALATFLLVVIVTSRIGVPGVRHVVIIEDGRTRRGLLPA